MIVLIPPASMLICVPSALIEALPFISMFTPVILILPPDSISILDEPVLQRNLASRLDRKIRTYFQRVIPAYRGIPLACHVVLVIRSDRLRELGVQGQRVVPNNMSLALSIYFLGVISRNGFVSIARNRRLLIARYCDRSARLDRNRLASVNANPLVSNDVDCFGGADQPGSRQSHVHRLSGQHIDGLSQASPSRPRSLHIPSTIAVYVDLLIRYDMLGAIRLDRDVLVRCLPSRSGCSRS